VAGEAFHQREEVELAAPHASLLQGGVQSGLAAGSDFVRSGELEAMPVALELDWVEHVGAEGSVGSGQHSPLPQRTEAGFV